VARVLFGTDYPFLRHEQWLSAFAELGLSDDITEKVLLRNAQRLLKVVNSLLDFARIEAGRREPLRHGVGRDSCLLAERAKRLEQVRGQHAAVIDEQATVTTVLRSHAVSPAKLGI